MAWTASCLQTATEIKDELYVDVFADAAGRDVSKEASFAVKKWMKEAVAAFYGALFGASEKRLVIDFGHVDDDVHRLYLATRGSVEKVRRAGGRRGLAQSR